MSKNCTPPIFYRSVGGVRAPARKLRCAGRHTAVTTTKVDSKAGAPHSAQVRAVRRYVQSSSGMTGGRGSTRAAERTGALFGCMALGDRNGKRKPHTGYSSLPNRQTALRKL
jgi:hypothetical protein